MATREDIEHYLIQIHHLFEAIRDNMWVIHDTVDTIVIFAPPLVILRTKLMEVPNTNREHFYKLLLELNASQMVHGAYGLEDNNVVIIDTLEVENLDLNEFQASLDAMSLAASQDYERLKAFRD